MSPLNPFDSSAAWPRTPPVGDTVIVDSPKRSSPSPHVWRICRIMRTHYDQPISLESLSARVGRNTAYMATLFRRQTGMTIHRYLTRVRMRRAATLLRRGEKVEVVMLLVGYRSKKNFYRQFEATFAVTPGQYKAIHTSSRSARPAPVSAMIAEL